ncbi:uncharacterized protein LOC125350550 [Perognathus longimembris pacificus]|uniref:uncharacterized protein LOC125350550 n=1 Tax=Perognathus longimembris pacificus TaxID=214514 RepID=UPI0020197280|nr:uncharacterized protein LOC125350550 [Perognathus longimembris pacificus]
MPAPSLRALGAGPLRSVAAAAAPGRSGGGLRAAPGSGSSGSPRPWGDPAEMEGTSAARATGEGLPPQLSSPKAWRGLLRKPGRWKRPMSWPGSGSRRPRRAQRGGKQEARCLADRQTGVRTNERRRWRAWQQIRTEKRGGTSWRAVTLFPPFGLEAPPFVFPAQSIKIGKKKKKPGPLRPCPPPLPASSPVAAAFAPHHV